jgi:glucose/arabinose dehydrogenase
MFSLNLGRIKRPWLSIWAVFILLFIALLTTSAHAEPFADPAFSQVWAKTDQAVALGTLKASWVWGPQGRVSRTEPYQQAPGGQRLVQYFDKARMEITNPNANRGSDWFVTSGLLCRELVSGQVQIGDAGFENRAPANVPIGGDLDSPVGPTYATFTGLASLNNYKRAPQKSGSVTEFINREGQVGNTTGFPDRARYTYYDNNLGHNIPDVFINWMNGLASRGLSWQYVIGLPLTEPYWARFKIAGVEKEVLVQLFERRALTFNPQNEPVWQVEMGNIGLHYWAWRYGSEMPAPTDSNPVNLPPVGNPYPSGPAPTAAPASGGTVAVQLEVPDEFKRGTFATPRTLNLPKGFSASLYAQLQGKARFMTVSPDGVVFASEMDGGRVVWLRDKGGSAERVVFAEGLQAPHGLAFYQTNGTTYLYVAEMTRVVRFPYQPGQTQAGAKEVIVTGLPGGGNHVTRSIAFGKDGKMYVSVGSSCNVCEEGDSRRAAVLQFNPDGSGGRIYASGLRNGVGLIVHPYTGEIWETENSRDLLGDNMPPDEINIIQDGKHYGWPYCISNGVWDSDFNRRNQAFCDTTLKPALPMQAHSAPLGISIYTGQQFPAEYQGDAFVGFHGSWNRSVPTGYKVVRIRVQNGRPASYEDFATGWLASGNVWGRPVMPLVAPDGSLLISDDMTNAVYKISYRA